jgi:hypothetical protein
MARCPPLLHHRHPGEGRDPASSMRERHWMIRFAHPFGAILRMFSALRPAFVGMTSKEAGLA